MRSGARRAGWCKPMRRENSKNLRSDPCFDHQARKLKLPRRARPTTTSRKAANMQTLRQFKSDLITERPQLEEMIEKDPAELRLSEQLRQPPKDAKLTQKAVAERTHVTRSYVAQLEGRPQNVTLASSILSFQVLDLRSSQSEAGSGLSHPLNKSFHYRFLGIYYPISTHINPPCRPSSWPISQSVAQPCPVGSKIWAIRFSPWGRAAPPDRPPATKTGPRKCLFIKLAKAAKSTYLVNCTRSKRVRKPGGSSHPKKRNLP